jgi:hypothetical protein
VTDSVSDVTRNLLEPPPKIVKPRLTVPTSLPVIAINQGMIVDENGEAGTLDELAERLPSMSSTLFVKMSAADWVAELDRIFTSTHSATWQWRVSENERDLVNPLNPKAPKLSLYAASVHYFGFKQYRNNKYHTIIDPIVMYGRKLNQIWPTDESDLTKLLKWGIAVRDFCRDNNLRVRPTIGSIGVQFLTDRRFYPKPRRKVPRSINKAMREQLPGNYYVLDVVPDPSNNFTAYYIDQKRAHHYHAQTTTFPHSDYLYAFGRFLDLAKPVFKTTQSDFTGLYCLDLEQPHKAVPHHWLNKVHDLRAVFVYSNELQHILDLGYRVTGVRAAWGSTHHDTGLNKYAKWAQAELDKYDDAPWLKPILLSTYGTLAIKPREIAALYRTAKRGEIRSLTTGHNKLTGKWIQGARKLEPKIANVLHRGMIEAATRSESSGLAQHLDGRGHRVLQIYADAVIVEADDDNSLPLLPEPWRIKDTLTHLQFINQQAFMSDQMSKLPGFGGREIARYRAHSIGRAPRKIIYDPFTNIPIKTERRI